MIAIRIVCGIETAFLMGQLIHSLDYIFENNYWVKHNPGSER